MFTSQSHIHGRNVHKFDKIFQYRNIDFIVNDLQIVKHESQLQAKFGERRKKKKNSGKEVQHIGQLE